MVTLNLLCTVNLRLCSCVIVKPNSGTGLIVNSMTGAGFESYPDQSFLLTIFIPSWLQTNPPIVSRATHFYDRKTFSGPRVSPACFNVSGATGDVEVGVVLKKSEKRTERVEYCREDGKRIQWREIR